MAAAWGISALCARVAGSADAPPERTAALIAAVLVSTLGSCALVYVLVRRRALTASELGIVCLGLVFGGLLAVDLYHVSAQVTFPGDFLIWSESDFVNDIQKLRVGYPFYSEQSNNDSFCYMPGAQVMTWLLATLLGRPDSLTTYRLVQVVWTVLASGLGTLTICRLLQAAGVRFSARERVLWSAIWMPALFLFATNATTNGTTSSLHNDALNQLLTVLAFWLLVEYTVTRNRLALVVLAVVPAAGFLVKQTSLIWAALASGHLVAFDPERSWRRGTVFGVSAALLVGAAFGLGYALWHDEFVYWNFKVLGSHGISPVRSVQHVLDAGMYFAAGTLGGVVLLRGAAFRTLIGPWLVWLAVLLVEAYTSGIAWMLNHMGPGCMLAGVWLLAGISRLWHEWFPISDSGGGWDRAVRRWFPIAGVATAFVLCLPSFGVVRLPAVPIQRDAYRYVRAIEREFEGLPADRVLLDAGSWMYIPSGTIQKDRAPTIGERAFSQTGDFSATVRRIREQRYARILVRHYQAKDFWYEHASWDRPSGIGAALADAYRVVRVIPGTPESPAARGYPFDDVSVLEPKPIARTPAAKP